MFRLVGRVPVAVRQPLVRAAKPSYTLGAMCLVHDGDGSVLLVRHSYRPDWGLPGGLLNRRESPAIAVVREVREEVDIDIEVDPAPVTVIDPYRQRVDIVYVASHRDGNPAPSSAEIAEACWFPRDALPELQEEVGDALRAVADQRTSGVAVFVVDRAPLP